MCSSSGASGSSGVLSMLIGLRAAHGQIGGACSLLCSARSFFGAATRSGSLSATLVLGGVLGEVNAVTGQRVDVRGRYRAARDAAAEPAQVVPAQVVGEDDDDVGRPLPGGPALGIGAGLPVDRLGRTDSGRLLLGRLERAMPVGNRARGAGCEGGREAEGDQAVASHLESSGEGASGHRFIYIVLSDRDGSVALQNGSRFASRPCQKPAGTPTHLVPAARAGPTGC